MCTVSGSSTTVAPIAIGAKVFGFRLSRASGVVRGWQSAFAMRFPAPRYADPVFLRGRTCENY
jgi:hypothetical protein